ncbi:trypsin Inhibitor like cysteine rich domain protein, partial [Oesophagostomum dentatum]
LISLPQEVCTEQCVIGCQCKSGFYRNDKNVCVSNCGEGSLHLFILGGKPPKPKKCPRNEEYKECGTACEPSCKNPNPQICTLQCVIGCQCKKGFFRNDKGVCVADCGGKEKPCGENEERKKCGTACEPSCSNPSPVCTKQCILNVCQCKPGYTRDDATNKCISYDSCPKGLHMRNWRGP